MPFIKIMNPIKPIKMPVFCIFLEAESSNDFMDVKPMTSGYEISIITNPMISPHIFRLQNN